jgi:hypothetical protein
MVVGDRGDALHVEGGGGAEEPMSVPICCVVSFFSSYHVTFIIDPRHSGGIFPFEKNQERQDAMVPPVPHQFLLSV